MEEQWRVDDHGLYSLNLPVGWGVSGNSNAPLIFLPMKSVFFRISPQPVTPLPHTALM